MTGKNKRSPSMTIVEVRKQSAGQCDHDHCMPPALNLSVESRLVDRAAG
jgi:hypothetical protein